MATLTVIVSIDNVDLRDFTTRVHGGIDAMVRAQGGEINVTDEQFFRYFVTALHDRVMWVTNGRYIARPDETWALPVPMAQILSSIGEVTEGPHSRYVPKWDSVGDEHLLTREEWQEITRLLLSLEALPTISFIHAMERSREGVARVMCLMQGSEEGQEFFYSNTPPHVLEVLVSMVAGLQPERGRLDVEALPPQLVPVYRIGRDWVVSYMHDFTALGYAG